MNDYRDLLSRGGISLERLATLASVHAAGGLSRAAGGDVSRLSQYSRQIKDLESFFEVQLTRKVGRTIRLTDDGQRLAALAQEQLRGLQCFAGESGTVMPSLALGAGNTLLTWHVLPRMGHLKKALPDYDLRLQSMRTRDLVRAVQDFRVDLALVRSTAVPRGLKKRTVLRMTYGLYVPSELVGKMSPREILAEVPLATSMGGSLREDLEQKAETAGLDLRIALSCSSITLAAEAVRLGQYAGILPDLASDGFQGTPVRRYDLPFKTGHERQILVVWHPRSPHTMLPRVVDVLKH